jgi:hypothetical protein
MTINATAAAALIIQAEQEGNDIEQEVIEEIGSLANSFLRYAKQLAAKLALLEFRKYARNNIKTGIKSIDEKIAQWGLVEGESFIINSKLDEQIEKLEETNPEAAALAEGLKDGFFDGMEDFFEVV